MPILAYIHTLGVYCVPGVTNINHVGQEIDQSYGLVKSIFRLNLEVFSQARFDQDKMLHISDIPLLVFGGKDDERTQMLVEDYFD